MANPKKKAPRPRPVRVPPKPATGLDDEITAQPRPLSDEVGESDGGQAGLSVDPEDLGVRFLSEATEQGDALPHSLMESELGPTTGLESDAVLTPPNFEHENTLWEQTVDLVTQTRNAADQLRGPPVVTDEDDELERELERESERESRRVHVREPGVQVPESDIRELSLFDDKSEEDADTVEAPLQSEVPPPRPAYEPGDKTAEPRPDPFAAASGGPFRRWTLQVTRTLILNLAAALKRWAEWLKVASARQS